MASFIQYYIHGAHLCCAEVHSLLLLCSVPLLDIPQCIYPSYCSQTDKVCYSPFWAVMNEALLAFLRLSCSGCSVHFRFSRGVISLSHRVGCIGITKHFLQGFCPILDSSQQGKRTPSGQHLILSVFWFLAALVGRQWYLVVTSVSMSPMASDIEHLLVCSQAILTPSLVSYFKIFAPFTTGTFSYWFIGALYIFRWGVLCQKNVMQTLYPGLWYTFLFSFRWNLSFSY